MYENAIDPVDTEIPDMSIDCTTEEGNKARMKVVGSQSIVRATE
jgi:hypothetical protein